MEHPLIHNIDNLTLEELQTKISDLSKKYNWAVRTNANLAQQIAMALETYRNKFQEKQQAIYDAAKKSGNDFSDKIDIS
jgi:N-acetylmuramic acid 6-phosphate (MurNAc-6-P) etherase